MNSRCKNKNCFYYKTCIMDNTNNKCSGKLSIKNPNHPNFQATTRGNDQGKEQINK